jgi:hypothetical protein
MVDPSVLAASIARAASAITGLMPYADVAELRGSPGASHALEQITAAMWRLRGMRDAALQLAKWDDVYAVVPRDYVTRLDRAAAECAEAIKALGGGRWVPIPIWKDYHPEVARKRNGKKNGRTAK